MNTNMTGFKSVLWGAKVASAWEELLHGDFKLVRSFSGSFFERALSGQPGNDDM